MTFCAILAAAAIEAAPLAAAPAPAPAEPVAALVEQEQEAIPENATAPEVLAYCRAMVPGDVEISGHVNRRSRHGTEVAAYRYVLTRRNGETNLSFCDKSGRDIPFERHGRLLETDITWSDLTMDYLWWTDVTFDTEASAETVVGLVCRTVLRLRKGNRAFRVWVDRRTGAVVQANELRLVDGAWKTVREVFCTSLKKFDDRWAPKNIEVGPPGAAYRTKIVIEDVK